MSGAIALDASKFPLVVITLPSNPTEDDTVALYRAYDPVLARGRHVLLVDLRRLNPVFGNAMARQATLREVEARNHVFEKVLIAEARLIRGTVIRGIVTAFEWMRRSPRTFPLEILEDEAEALRFLNEHLTKDQAARSLPAGPVSRRTL